MGGGVAGAGAVGTGVGCDPPELVLPEPEPQFGGNELLDSGHPSETHSATSAR